MNHMCASRFYLVVLISLQLHAGYEAIPSIPSAPTSSSASMFLSSALTSTNQQPMQDLLNTVVSYPHIGISSDHQTVHQAILNRATKAMPPKKTQAIFKSGNFTILLPSAHAFENYPSGSELFTNYAAIAAQFDTMITQFKQDRSFIPFFRKVHINVLNELYQYLMGIYVNFNLQHTGIIQKSNGSLQISVPKFLDFETSHAANIKTLIINHLINIIESQFNGAIRSYVPKLPQTFATFIGRAAIQNDFSVDLTQFIVQQLEPDLVNYKQMHLQALAAYLSFFQTLTSYLHQPHSKYPQHFNAFVEIAEHVNQFLYGQNTNNEDKEIIALRKMNPPLLCFTYEDVAALKIIPYLAHLLPSNVQSITWPDHIVQAANDGSIITPPNQQPHPIAYFKNDQNKVVKNFTNNTSIDLYICMRLGQNLFEEKLIPQPDWLNSWEGISKIVQACYGDFSALIGMNILDPCMESLISNVIMTQQGQDPNPHDPTQYACKALIASWKKETKILPSQQPVIPQPTNLLQSPPMQPVVSTTPIAPLISPALLTQPGIE